jgi:hypothetical protein
MKKTRGQKPPDTVTLRIGSPAVYISLFLMRLCETNLLKHVKILHKFSVTVLDSALLGFW